MADPDGGEGGPARKDKVLFEQSMSVADLSSPDTAGAAATEYETPCTITGLMSGVSGGALGYVFGFGGKLLQHRGKGRWRACAAEGWTSAKTFAVMGGVYAMVSCFAKRIRQKEDAFNGAISGCATGLVLGYKGGPLSALQSCGGLALFSYVFDLLGANSTANAAPLQQQSFRAHGGSQQRVLPAQRTLNAVPAAAQVSTAIQQILAPALAPAAMLLAPLCPGCTVLHRGVCHRREPPGRINFPRRASPTIQDGLRASDSVSIDEAAVLSGHNRHVSA